MIQFLKFFPEKVNSSPPGSSPVQQQTVQHTQNLVHKCTPTFSLTMLPDHFCFQCVYRFEKFYEMKFINDQRLTILVCWLRQMISLPVCEERRKELNWINEQMDEHLLYGATSQRIVSYTEGSPSSPQTTTTTRTISIPDNPLSFNLNPYKTKKKTDEGESRQVMVEKEMAKIMHVVERRRYPIKLHGYHAHNHGLL